jgi:carbonic anhydrase
VPWSYQGKSGPLSWGRLSPAYRACSDGHEQSPIDIHGAHRNKALQPIEFHYLAGGVTLKNTGSTIEVQVHPGSYIIAGGTRYALESFTFHHPAEHAVNGRLTDMDVQLLHRSSDGKLAIVASRLMENRDAPNATVAALWEHLPFTPGATTNDPDMINPGGLLPGDRGYWTYLGSLTTPPCTEGVRWFVMEQPITVSTDQLKVFSSLFRINSRPIQDTHDRMIEANQ